MPDPTPQDIKEVTAYLPNSKRDSTGFAVSDQPSITEPQFIWLSHRLGTRTDEEACALTYAESETPIDLPEVEQWRRDPVFESVYQDMLKNKREAFKYLITQMNGKALRVLWGLLHSSRERAQVQGLQLLLRAQGLLIDKVQTTDPEAIHDLMAQLRAPRPVVIQGVYKELPPGNSDAAS